MFVTASPSFCDQLGTSTTKRRAPMQRLLPFITNDVTLPRSRKRASVLRPCRSAGVVFSDRKALASNRPCS